MLLTDALQDIYDTANYTYRHGDGEAAVDELAARIRGLLDHCEKSTEESHAALLSVYERRIVNGEADDDGFSKFHPNNYAAMVPGRDFSDVDLAPPFPDEYVDRYKQRVSMNKSAAHVGNDCKRNNVVMRDVSWTEDPEIEAHFQATAENSTDIHWQYFGSSNGVLRTFPGHPWKVTYSGWPYDCELLLAALPRVSLSDLCIVCRDCSQLIRGSGLGTSRRFRARRTS